jgi:Tol biopolymer transport system component
VYDPTVTKVLYVGRDLSKLSIVLRDIQKNDEIFRQTILNMGGQTPIWSPDGKQAIVNLALENVGEKPSENLEELYSITKDGGINQETRFSTHFDQSTFAYSNWSPDGTKVAFLVNLQPFQYPILYPDQEKNIYYRLGILDTVGINSTNYCLPGENSYPPIWSPDGKEIALSYSYESTPPNKGHAYIFDINKRSIERIAENVVPLGWMLLP